MQIQTEHLLPAIDLLLPVTSKRTTLPILNHFRLESDGEILTISATDLDQYAEQKVECNGKLEACCVNAFQFALLAESAVDKIGVTQTKGELKITANGIAVLKTLPAEDFVPSPNDKQIKQGCNCVDLADCIETVSFSAAARNEERFVLQHVNIMLESKRMETQATNAKTLATTFKPLMNGEANFLCHSDYAGIFCKYLRSKNAIMSLGESYFSVKSDSGTWFGKLPQEKWPKDGVKGMLSAKKNKVGTVLVEEIKNVVDLALSLCKDAAFNWATLLFTKKSLMLSCEVGNKEPYEKEILGSFNPFEARMDLRVLSTAFQKLKSDETIIFEGEGKIFMSDGNLDLCIATLTPK